MMHVSRPSTGSLLALLCVLCGHFLDAAELKALPSASAPVKIVFDTDMMTDCDDAGAMAVLHALADRGECEILATVASVGDPKSIATVDVINRYYGRPGLPLGMVKAGGVQQKSLFTARVTAEFPHGVKSGEAVPDVTRVYREVLERQPDQSVVIVTVGYLTNLKNLLQLPASEGHLSGPDLIRRKVKTWVCMGGNFIGHPPKDDLKLGNVNFQRDAASALFVIQHWPGPVIFAGREVCSVPSGLAIGASLAKTPTNNPVRRAYEHYFGGTAKNRHVADLATVLHAVRGLRDYWNLSEPGRMDLQASMTFEWKFAADGNQRYLLKRQRDGQPNDRYVEAALNELLVRPPRAAEPPLLPPGWDAKAAGDKVMAGLFQVSAPEVKGAHDAEFVMVGGRAYVVYEANNVQPGEAANWPFVYVALAVVNAKTRAVERHLPIARSRQAFANETLPAGACFVPRILQLNDRTLRCYFASESPGQRQSVTWFIDFDLERLAFANQIHRARLTTAAGTGDLTPQRFHADAAALGFQRPPKDFGLYIFDSFKGFDGRTYVALNNYPGGQNALAVLNAARDTFEVLGHFNEPAALKLTESAVNRLPDGSWLAICRQEGGNANYTFTTSPDGRHWSTNAFRALVPNGTSSKPTFDRFNGIYYLGWQEATRVAGVARSVFNLDVSRDGVQWERKYRFETVKSFQYPAFHQHAGAVYLTVTQGDTDASRKERIMFGRLE